MKNKLFEKIAGYVLFISIFLFPVLAFAGLIATDKKPANFEWNGSPYEYTLGYDDSQYQYSEMFPADPYPADDGFDDSDYSDRSYYGFPKNLSVAYADYAGTAGAESGIVEKNNHSFSAPANHKDEVFQEKIKGDDSAVIKKEPESKESAVASNKPSVRAESMNFRKLALMLLKMVAVFFSLLVVI